MQEEYPYIQYMYSYPHKTAYRPLKAIVLEDYIERLYHADNSLYFHIPFCQYKCGYCNLFSVAEQSSSTGKKEETLMEQYIEAMERHAQQLAELLYTRFSKADICFSDLTVGGGTPMLLPPNLLRRLFKIADMYFFSGERDKKEVIVETSPNQTTQEKLEILKAYGTTRVSIGIQSFNEKELSALQRFHSPETAKRALVLLKNMQFHTVNVDFIYGIPGQTKQSLLDSLKRAADYEPEEFFVYPLYVKKGTWLYDHEVRRSKQAVELYHAAVEYLVGRGYRQLSMRRFVRKRETEGEPACISCGFGNTLSVGCGGRSYLGKLHFCTPYAISQKGCGRILQKYLSKENFLTVDNGILLSEDEQKRRYVMKHLFFFFFLCMSD